MVSEVLKLWFRLFILNARAALLERKMNQPFYYVVSYKMDKILQEIEAIKCELSSYYQN